MTEDELIKLLESQCKAAGGPVAWGRAHGIAPSYIREVMNRNTPPGQKIPAALGLQRVVLYEPAPRR